MDIAAYGGWFMEVHNQAQRIKFVPLKPIETENKDVKPCIVVFKNKAYRVSSWREFYKIAYYNNIKYNKNINSSLLVTEADKKVINKNYPAICKNGEESDTHIKFSNEFYARCFIHDKNNINAITYAVKNYNLEFELYFASKEGKLSSEDFEMCQNDYFESLKEDTKVKEKSTKYHIAHVNGKVLTDSEKFFKKIEKEFDKKTLIGDIYIDDNEEVLLNRFMTEKLKYILMSGKNSNRHNKVFAYGLVRYAMKYYQRKSFWPFFAEEYGVSIPANYQGIINAAFESIMKDNKKLYFDVGGKSNYVQNICMHAFICNNCADQLFDYIFEFWRIDLSRSLENISDGAGNDLFEILIDEIASNENTSVQDIMLHTTMALKLNAKGCKNRIRRILKMIDYSFFDNADYSSSTNRISQLFEAWKNSSSSKYSIEWKKTAKGKSRGRGEKLLSSPTIIYNAALNSFELKLPKEILRYCDETEYPDWTITIGDKIRKVTPTLLAGKASLYSDECSMKLTNDDLFSEIYIVLSSEKRVYIRTTIQKDNIRFFTNKFRHINPADGYLSKDVSFAFIKKPYKLEKIGPESGYINDFADDIKVYTLKCNDGDIYILPDGKALSVGMPLSDGLVGTSEIAGVIAKVDDVAYKVVKNVDRLFFKTSRERMNGTMIKITNNNKTLFSGRINESNIKEFKLDEKTKDNFGYLISLDTYINGDGLYEIELNIPGLNVRKYYLCYIDGFWYRYDGAPYIFKNQGTIAIPVSMKNKIEDDFEVFDGEKRLSFRFTESDDKEINDYIVNRDLVLNVEVGGQDVELIFDVPSLYWKFSKKDNWSYQKPDIISVKNIPEKIFVSGSLPLMESTIFVNDELRDESEVSPNKEGTLYYFRSIDFIESLDREKDYRELALSIGGKTYPFVTVACRSIVKASSITGDFKKKKIYGDFDIFGSSEYSISITHEGENVEQDIPLIDGHFEVECDVEEGDYVVSLFEQEEDESGFGSVSYKLGSYPVKLTDVRKLENKVLVINNITYKEHNIPLNVKTGYRIGRLKLLNYDNDIRGKMDIHSWLYDSCDESIMSGFTYYKGKLTYRSPERKRIDLCDVLVIFDNDENINQILLFAIDDDEAQEPIVNIKKGHLMPDDRLITRLERRLNSVVLYDDTFTIRITIKDFKKTDASDKKVFTVSVDKKTLVRDCYFSSLTKNVLLANGVIYVEQLEQITRNQFRKFKNLGTRSIKEIEDYMQRKCIRFQDER